VLEGLVVATFVGSDDMLGRKEGWLLGWLDGKLDGGDDILG